METMIKQLAVMATLMILLSLFAFLYIAANALGADRALSAMTGFTICLLLTPITWKFCLREARDAQGK